MNKQAYIGTLKMLGVSSKDSLFFVDSMDMYHLCINRDVKKKYLETILNTKIYGKSFKDWYLSFIRKYPLYDEQGIRIKTNDIKFTIDNITVVQIRNCFDLILNEYYIQEGYTAKV